MNKEELYEYIKSLSKDKENKKSDVIAKAPTIKSPCFHVILNEDT